MGDSDGGFSRISRGAYARRGRQVGRTRALSADLESERPMEDEVIQFVAHETGYRAHTAQGMRLDVIRMVSIQPDIETPEGYFTWLWAETIQGFYLMRQRVTASGGEAWQVVREFVPRDSYGFYFDFQDVLRPALRASGEVTVSLGARPPGTARP